MKTREQWQAETKVIRDMAELIWKTSIPFEEKYEEDYLTVASHDAYNSHFGVWERQLMRTYNEMIDMALDRDDEDEDYPTVKEVTA